MSIPNFTPRETEVLSLAMTCLKDPKALAVDYNKLAEKGNFKNAASAGAVFGVIKKKLLAVTDGTGADGGNEDSGTTPAKTPITKKPSAKKGASKADQTDDSTAATDGDNTGDKPAPTPKSKAKSTPKSKAATSIIEADTPTAADAETPTQPPKKRARKPKDETDGGSTAAPTPKRTKKTIVKKDVDAPGLAASILQQTTTLTEATEDNIVKKEANDGNDEELSARDAEILALLDGPHGDDGDSEGTPIDGAATI